MPVIVKTVNTIATTAPVRVAKATRGMFCNIYIQNSTATGSVFMNDSDHALQGVGVTLVATTGVFQSDKEIEDIWLHAAVDGTVVTIKYAYRPMR